MIGGLARTLAKVEDRMAKQAKPTGVDPATLLGRILNFGAFGLLVIFGLYVADDLQRMSRDGIEFQRAYQSQIQQQAELEEIQRGANRITSSIRRIEGRMVSKERMSGVDDRIVELAQMHECVLRKSLSQGRSSEALFDEEDEGQGSGFRSNDQARFLLEKESVLLTVEGTLEQLFAFVEGISSESWLCSTDEMNLQPSGSQSETLTLDIEISFCDVVANSNFERDDDLGY